MIILKYKHWWHRFIPKLRKEHAEAQAAISKMDDAISHLLDLQIQLHDAIQNRDDDSPTRH